MFEIGKQVVCISDNWQIKTSKGWSNISYPVFSYPVKYCVYTIRDIWGGNPKEIGLLLQEVVNIVVGSIVLEDNYIYTFGCGLAELNFSARNFRPVKETSIDVFKQLLNPIDKLLESAINHQ